MPDWKDELAQYAQTGNEAAFRRLVENYGSLVLHSARRRVGDADLAEEVAQNVFAALARKAKRVGQYQSISAWLFESTRREAAQVMRSQSRHRRRVEALKGEVDFEMTSDDHAKELRELRPHLEEAMDGLKSGEREILFARFFEERSFREIAREAGKSESACKMSLTRALEKLQRFLSGRGITFSAVTLGMLLQTEFAEGAPVTTLNGVATDSLLRLKNPGFGGMGAMVTHPVVLMVAAAMVLLIAGAMIVRENVAPAELADEGSQGGRRSSSWEGREAVVVVRERSRIGAHEVDLVETHQVKDLGEFYLPELVVEEATLGEVMERVLRQYRDICAETLEVKLPLGWRLEGNAELIRNLKFQGDLLSFCRLLALKSKTMFEVDEHCLTFAEISDGPITTRRWTVPPTFVTSLRGILAKEELGQRVEIENPFGTNELGAEEEPKFQGLLEDLLRAEGILAEGETFVYFLGSSRIVVTASARSMRLMDLLVQISNGAMPRQIRYSLNKGGDGEDVQLPSLVALPGQSGTVEVGKEYLEMRDGEVIEAWVGTRVAFTPELYGLGERTKVSFWVMEEPEADDLARYEKSGRLDDLNLEEFKVEDRMVTSTAAQRLENLPVEFFGMNREGVPLSFSYVVERIDATGRRVFGKKEEAETGGSLEDLPMEPLDKIGE